MHLLRDVSIPPMFTLSSDSFCWGVLHMSAKPLGCLSNSISVDLRFIIVVEITCKAVPSLCLDGMIRFVYPVRV